jgi:hypothetical protein
MQIVIALTLLYVFFPEEWLKKPTKRNYYLFCLVAAFEILTDMFWNSLEKFDNWQRMI